MLLVRIENFPNQLLDAALEKAIMEACRPYDAAGPGQGVAISFTRHRLGSAKIAVITVEPDMLRPHLGSESKREQLASALARVIAPTLSTGWRFCVRVIMPQPDGVAKSGVGISTRESGPPVAG